MSTAQLIAFGIVSWVALGWVYAVWRGHRLCATGRHRWNKVPAYTYSHQDGTSFEDYGCRRRDCTAFDRRQPGWPKVVIGFDGSISSDEVTVLTSRLTVGDPPHTVWEYESSNAYDPRDDRPWWEDTIALSAVPDFAAFDERFCWKVDVSEVNVWAVVGFDGEGTPVMVADLIDGNIDFKDITRTGDVYSDLRETEPRTG